MRRAWLAATLVLMACPPDFTGAPEAPAVSERVALESTSRVPEGTWGGQHVRLEVTAEGAQVEFDCAHGRINGALSLDRDGNFDVAGVFVQEHGGPVRSDEAEDAQPARYSGTTKGDTLELKVNFANGKDALGPYRLVRGQAGRVVKCL